LWGGLRGWGGGVGGGASGGGGGGGDPAGGGGGGGGARQKGRDLSRRFSFRGLTLEESVEINVSSSNGDVRWIVKSDHDRDLQIVRVTVNHILSFREEQIDNQHMKKCKIKNQDKLTKSETFAGRAFKF